MTRDELIEKIQEDWRVARNMSHITVGSLIRERRMRNYDELLGKVRWCAINVKNGTALLEIVNGSKLIGLEVDLEHFMSAEIMNEEEC